MDIGIEAQDRYREGEVGATGVVPLRKVGRGGRELQGGAAVPEELVGLIAEQAEAGIEEAVGGVEAEEDGQVDPAMADIDAGRSEGGVDPVDDAGQLAPGPDDVAGVVVAVDEGGLDRGRIVPGGCDDRSPSVGLIRPGGDLQGVESDVTEVGSRLLEAPVDLGAVNGGQHRRHLIDVRSEVCWRDIDAAGESGHEDGGRITMRTAGVDGEEARGSYLAGGQEFEGGCFTGGEIGFALEPIGADVAAQDGSNQLSVGVAEVDRVGRAGGAAAQSTEAGDSGAGCRRTQSSASGPGLCRSTASSAWSIRLG